MFKGSQGGGGRPHESSPVPELQVVNGCCPEGGVFSVAAGMVPVSSPN